MTFLSIILYPLVFFLLIYTLQNSIYSRVLKHPRNFELNSISKISIINYKVFITVDYAAGE